MNTNFTIDGHEYYIEFDVEPGCRGAHDRYGAPLEPDTGPEVTVLQIIDDDGKHVDPEVISDADYDRFCNHALSLWNDQVAADRNDPPEPKEDVE